MLLEPRKTHENTTWAKTEIILLKQVPYIITTIPSGLNKAQWQNSQLNDENIRMYGRIHTGSSFYRIHALRNI